MNIIIADDVLIIRKLIRQIVEAHGHHIIAEASTGEEAISLYREYHPDLIMLDIVMTNLNGIECTKKIKEIDSNAKIIIVSGLGQETMVEEATKAGALFFINKPVKAQDLIQTLEKLN